MVQHLCTYLEVNPQGLRYTQSGFVLAFPAGTNGLSAMLEKGVELAAALQRQDTVCALQTQCVELGTLMQNADAFGRAPAGHVVGEGSCVSGRLGLHDACGFDLPLG